MRPRPPRSRPSGGDDPVTRAGIALALVAGFAGIAVQGYDGRSNRDGAAPPTPTTPATPIAFDAPLRQGALVRGRALGLVSITLSGVAVPVSGDGAFLLGFDRDASRAATLAATFRDGRTETRTLDVAPRAWPLRRLPTLRRGTPRTPEGLARRAAEVARIDAARGAMQPTDGWRQRFRWPVTGRISGIFGSQTIYAGEPGGYHSGVDVARPTGTPVVAPADGIVVLASPPAFSVEGNLLIVDHGAGLSSAFLHLSRIDVSVGARVRQGQPIGAIGTTGRSTGPHLHWGMVWRPGLGEGVRVDPQQVAGPMPG